MNDLHAHKFLTLKAFCYSKSVASLCLLFSLSSFLPAIEVINMRPITYSGDPRESYKYQLIDLLLSHTKEKYGAYEIRFNSQVNSQKREISLLNEGKINVFISMTSRSREVDMLAIRYPVYKGLYGYRVFIIKSSEQKKFSSIRNLEQLKTLLAVQGSHWPDYEILKSNGLNVTGSSSSNSQFQMLQHGHVDYFPRGIHEPWKELTDRPNTGLAIEKNLMLYYPAPGYIFVAKNNIQLARRLREGFKKIIESGEFDHFFNQHPQIVEMKRQADLENRLLFKLSNPLLSPYTPLKDKRLWFNIDNESGFSHTNY